MSAVVQRCAKEVLGEEPVTFPGFVEEDTIGVRNRPAPGNPAPYMWRPGNRYNQVWIDAATTDALTAMVAPEVIQFKGHSWAVQEDKTWNHSVGSRPKMMFILSTSAEHGTHVHFPQGGARGGKARAFEGYTTALDDISEAERRHIIDFAYYNRAKAVEQLPAGYQNRPYDYSLFRVRLLQLVTHKLCG